MEHSSVDAYAEQEIATTIKQQKVDDFLNQKDPTGELRQTAAKQEENKPLNVIVAGGRNYSD